MTELLDQFDREVEVAYRGEVYRVRDNGAIYREPRPGMRRRKLDDVWTFGTPSTSSGYMHINSEVVHRIVATAFHGEQPSERHIVDHIDTNRRNNRPENLRWITRLDNVLQNPITRKRIIAAYGSLEAFFNNPSSPSNPTAIRDFDWMRAVTKQEAEESRARLLNWAKSDKAPAGGRLGEWIYGKQQTKEPAMEEVHDRQSLTPMAIQRNWKTPTEFPLCPASTEPGSLDGYAERLEFGTIFSKNQFGASPTVTAEAGDGVLSILISMTGSGVKNWALTKVTIENGKFVHESVRTYFTLQGALKNHCEILGIPLDESIDDYS